MVLAMAAALLALLTSWTVWTPPEPVSGPCVQELVVARNLYAVSGDNGWAHEYLVDWPEYADYITGAKEIPPGGIQAGQGGESDES